MTPQRPPVLLPAAAVTVAAVAWWLLAMLAPGAPAGVAPHLALALAALLPSLVLLAAMLVVQMGMRGRFHALDPLAGNDNHALRANQRVITNTVEQLTIFAPALLALAAGAPAARMGPVVALAWVFALARLAFWIGYLIGPLYRAPGMAVTFIVNLITLAGAIWVWLV